MGCWLVHILRGQVAQTGSHYGLVGYITLRSTKTPHFAYEAPDDPMWQPLQHIEQWRCSWHWWKGGGCRNTKLAELAFWWLHDMTWLHYSFSPSSTKKHLNEPYPNVWLPLWIASTLPLTAPSAERSFSKLKLIKAYLRSSMGQDRLTGLAIISINHEIGKQLSYDDIIDDFASKKFKTQ